LSLRTLLLAALFVGLPLADIALLMAIGSALGPVRGFLLVLVTGVLGAWLAKREGLGVLRQLSEDLKGGLPPGSRIMEGALVVMGGLLLMTPGVITDTAGFLLILPPFRRRIAPVLVKRLVGALGIEVGAPRPGGALRQPAGSEGHVVNPFSSPFDDL
jgi:UPF0716 protein FxsA